MTRHWNFLELEKGSAPSPFQEWQEISPEQAVEAIAHTALQGGKIELYLSEDGAHTPETGLLFEGGSYVGYGLSEPPLSHLLPPLDEPILMFDGDEKPVAEDARFVVAYFKEAMKG